jgi:ABC-type amino acid transport substrate-binding protein
VDRRAALTTAVAVLVAAAGCGTSFPSDPDGTLDRVRGSGVVRAGAAPSDGLVEVGAGGPTGPEPRLVEDFAKHLGARVEWVVAGEEHLVTRLEDGSLDLAVGGFTRDNLWVERVGLTRPVVETAGGTAHAWMVPLGENAWQSAVERWRDGQGLVDER